MICEVCKKNEAIGVACVPGVAYSAAFCPECLKVGAIPYSIAVANTACCGGYDSCAEWWKFIVDRTLDRLEKTHVEFLQDVEKSLEEMDGNSE